MAMTLRTDEQLDAALDRLSQLEGVSKQEVIKRAVLDRARRKGQLARVLERNDELTERWAEALDYLGKA